MKNRTFNTATLVAMLSLAILVMAGCGNDKPSAPAEKVVNLDSLTFDVYEKGPDTVIAGCDTTGFRWKDCEGAFHPGTKFIPSYGKPITLQGEKADVGKIIGLSDGQHLVIRDGRNELAKLETSAPAEGPMISAEEDGNSASGWNDIPWHLIGWILFAASALGLIFFTAGALRRLGHWTNAPLARHGRSDGDETKTPPSDKTSDKSPVGGKEPGQPLPTTINYHEATEPQMAVRFQDEGENPMTFEVVGNFRLPLQVKVAKGKEDPTVVTFGRPDEHNNQPNNGNRGENRNRQER